MDQGLGADEAGEDEGTTQDRTKIINFLIYSRNDIIHLPHWQSLCDYYLKTVNNMKARNQKFTCFFSDMF